MFDVVSASPAHAAEDPPIVPSQRRGPATACAACPSRSIGLCRDFDKDELDRVFGVSSRLCVAHDVELVRQGDLSRHVLTVMSGALMLARISADGRRFVINFVWPGDMIGVFAEETNVFSAFALGPTEVCRHTKAQFSTLIENSPRLAHRLFVHMHANLSVAQDHMASLGLGSARERVAIFLLRLQERQGRLEKMSPRVDLPMRRFDVAAYLGLSVETVSRLFQEFVRKKIIIVVPDGVRILAREALVAISEASVDNVDSPRLRAVSGRPSGS